MSGSTRSSVGEARVRHRRGGLPQLGRFALTGILVALIYFGLMAFFSLVVGLPDQAALALAYVLAVALHFTLNRRFVFVPEGSFAHRLTVQGMRYLVVSGACYAITAIGVAVLPAVFGISPLVSYYIVAGTLPILSFLTLRAWVFPPASDPRELR